MTGTVRTTGTGMYAVDFVGTTATTGGAICSIPNPEGVDLFILRSFVLFTTASTGSATIDVGVAAAATTSASDCISALEASSTTGKLYNASAIIHATKTEVTVDWPSDYFVTITGSATTAGLVGTLFIEYVRAE